MSLSAQWLDELRERITLSSLIGRSVPLKRAGREYKACCPFHGEKTPSFTVSDDKGFYHCFGCGAHGDAIRWLTDHRGLGFIDAVKELAAEAGMEMPAADPRAAERAERRGTLFDVMAAAQGWFAEQLHGLEGSSARDYLAARGISDEAVRTFGIGLAPGGRGRLKRALEHFGEAKLIEAGLLISVEDKESYDRFRGRIMIPIRDSRGRVIAFGGRILGDGEPKYLNSPDTPLFDKGRTLFNLDRAAPAARKTGRIIVAEGYMDVIALGEAGFEEAVAPMGTALTEEQLRLLWKQAPVPTLCFDGDASGQKAAMRAAERALPLLRPGTSLAFAAMPPGKDPDDVIRAGGARAFAELIEKPQPLSEMLWQHEYRARPLDTPEARAGLKQRLRERLNAISDPDIRRHYAEQFARRHDSLFFAANSPRAPHSPPPHKRRFAPSSGEARGIGQSGLAGAMVRAIIAGLLRYPGHIRDHFEALSRLGATDAGLDRLLTQILAVSAREERLDTQKLLTILDDTDLGGLARKLLAAETLNFAFNRELSPTRSESEVERAKQDLSEAIDVIANRPVIEAELAKATLKAQESLDEESFAEQQRLGEAMHRFDRRLAELIEQHDELI